MIITFITPTVKASLSHSRRSAILLFGDCAPASAAAFASAFMRSRTSSRSWIEPSCTYAPTVFERVKVATSTTAAGQKGSAPRSSAPRPSIGGLSLLLTEVECFALQAPSTSPCWVGM